MTKNYLTIFFFLCLAQGQPLLAQEIKTFTLHDFDLRGKVKTCTVITDYGKEEFFFNEEGLLTKLITRYSGNDYSVTVYHYQDGELAEKRLESYRDGAFDEQTSIANIYTVDTTEQKKITEKIISYSKEFLEQNEYQYNQEGLLTGIKRTTNDGMDDIKLDYTTYKTEETVTTTVNGIIVKTVRTSLKNKSNGDTTKTILTKEFVDGEPINALEQVYNTKGKLVSEVTFVLKEDGSGFKPQQTTTYKYGANGVLESTTTKTDTQVAIKNFIYQYDGESGGNWIKKIITPQNTYTTRKITYYPVEETPILKD